MATRVQDNAEQQRYEIDVDGTLAGFADYQRSERSILLPHTEVDDAYEGQGLGSELVSHVLDAARHAGLAVLPRCPFVAEWIKHHPDYLDLVPGGRREEFGL